MNRFNWKLEHKKDCHSRLTDWWKSHGAFEGGVIPYESMPQRVYTSMLKDGTELYSVVVYITDSNMAWIGWITSNPKATNRQKYKALEYLYEVISIELSKQGFNILVSKTKERGLQRVLGNTGFQNIEPNTNFYIKNIG